MVIEQVQLFWGNATYIHQVVVTFCIRTGFRTLHTLRTLVHLKRHITLASRYTKSEYNIFVCLYRIQALDCRPEVSGLSPTLSFTDSYSLP